MRGGTPPRALRREIPPSLDAVDALCRELRSVLDANGLGPASFAVELLARESLNNAVLHGAGREGRVSADLRVGPRWLRLRVEDGGPGFPWRRQRRAPPTWRRRRAGGSRCASSTPTESNSTGRATGSPFGYAEADRRSPVAHYAIEHGERTAAVTLQGDLTAAVAAGLQADLREIVKPGLDEVVFDLGAASMLDSSGMGLLIAVANTLSRTSGKIKVVNLSAEILQLLQSMRLAARLNASGREAREPSPREPSPREASHG